MYTRRLFCQTNLRIISVGTLAGCYNFLSPTCSKENRECRIDQEDRTRKAGYSLASILSSIPSSLQTNKTMLEEVSVASRPLQNRRTCLQSSVRDIRNTNAYDFIIIGYGNTGQSALRTLREECPHARIALVDPLLAFNKGKKKLMKWVTLNQYF